MNQSLQVVFVCDACDGDGWVPAPVQHYDEVDLVPCHLCKGQGVRWKRIYPDVVHVPDADLPEDYDPFADYEEVKQDA